MTIASMTGFARCDGDIGRLAWTWEAKSVNGRGLDIRCRLPQGNDEYEVVARKLVGKKFARGNFNLVLTLRQLAGQSNYQVNQELLDQLLSVAEELSQRSGGDLQPPSVDGLLAVRGVVEQSESPEDADDADELKTIILQGLDDVLNSLATMRHEEGTRIAEILDSQLTRIAELCDAALAAAEAQPEALKERFLAQVAELIDETEKPLPEERVAQEVAILVTKSDIREEIDRLGSHLTAARDLLDEGGAVGRRLDFLCQEFTREANTICSKASDIELTNIGLELKAVVEQFREQVQNIE